MKSTYQIMSECFEKLAECCRSLADADVTEAVSSPKKEKQADDVPWVEESKKVIDIAEVRKVLAEKTQSGKGADVRSLLSKYGAKKLSDVNSDNYEALLKDAEVL